MLCPRIGSTIWLLIFVSLAARARDRAFAKRNVSDKAMGSMSSVHEKWGVKGIGLFGPIFPGVTVASIIGLALGSDAKERAKWMSIGAASLYLVYTLGIWLLFARWR